MANPNVLNITMLQDIQISDVTLRSEYYQKFTSGDFIGSQAIIDDNPQLQSKVLGADNFNRLINGILTMENKFKTDVPDYLNTMTSNFQFNIDNLIYLHTYIPTKQYLINNFVLYNDEIYFCLANPPIGELPTNTTYWLYCGLKGKQGSAGLGLNLIGKWNTNNPYIKDEVVTFEDGFFIALRENQNKSPNISPLDWELLISIGRAKIIISQVAPVNPPLNQQWWELMGTLSVMDLLEVDKMINSIKEDEVI